MCFSVLRLMPSQNRGFKMMQKSSKIVRIVFLGLAVRCLYFGGKKIDQKMAVFLPPFTRIKKVAGSSTAGWCKNRRFFEFFVRR